MIDKIHMLLKLGKYLTYKASIQIYRQVILTIMDYAGFLVIAYGKKKVKNEFQIMQNDALHFCNSTRLNDKVSLVKLHRKAKLASLEERRRVQLLSLMYLFIFFFFIEFYLPCLTFQIEKFVFQCKTALMNM